MAMLGKRGSEGSAAVLDAPEPVRVQETQWPIPEPAPAGTLQRRKAQPDDDNAKAWPEDEDTYTPRRLSPVHRLRMTLVRTVAGRIVGATIVLVVVGVALAAVAGAR